VHHGFQTTLETMESCGNNFWHTIHSHSYDLIPVPNPGHWNSEPVYYNIRVCITTVISMIRCICKLQRQLTELKTVNLVVGIAHDFLKLQPTNTGKLPLDQTI